MRRNPKLLRRTGGGAEQACGGDQSVGDSAADDFDEGAMQRRTALDQLRKSWWFAWIVAIVLALSHVNDAADGIDRVLVLLRVKPDSLALAQEAKEGEFSRTLTETAFQRLFWARAYVARVKLGAGGPQVDQAWESYIAASEAWIREIMVLIVVTEKFYGIQRSEELEYTVQPAINRMGQALINIRYAKAGADVNPMITDANTAIDAANAAVYHFVRGVSEREGQSLF